MLKKVWSVDIAETESITEEEKTDTTKKFNSWIPVVGETQFGYLSENGEILHKEDTLFNVALTAGEHVNYSRMGESLVLRRPGEGYFFRIAGTGYPFYRNEKLFLLSHDRMSIESVGPTGEMRFEIDFPTMVTAVAIGDESEAGAQSDTEAMSNTDAGNEMLVVGLLNGKTVLYSMDGEKKGTLKPQEGRMPVYGVAASSAGETVAVLWGDGPQHLSLFRKETNEYSEVDRFSRESVMLRESLVRFSKDQTLLFYEVPEGIVIVDPKEKETILIPLSGNVFDVYSRGKGAPVFVAGNRGEGAFLHVYNRRGETIAEETILEPMRSFLSSENRIIYTAGNTAVCIEEEVM